jgi:hypothetical protein
MCFWGAYYNQENLKWRAEIEAKSTVDLIFEAGMQRVATTSTAGTTSRVT